MIKKPKKQSRGHAPGAGCDRQVGGPIPVESAVARNERTPWLDKSGEPLLPGLLRQRSKSWSLKTWDRYCEHLNSQDYAMAESRISPKTLEEELEGMTYEIDECLEGSPDYSDLELAMKALNSAQRAVIESLFWAGQTVRETAEFLGLPRSTVQDLKSSALSKLYAKIPDTSPLMRGKVVFLPKKEGRKRAA